MGHRTLDRMEQYQVPLVMILDLWKMRSKFASLKFVQLLTHNGMKLRCIEVNDIQSEILEIFYNLFCNGFERNKGLLQPYLGY